MILFGKFVINNKKWKQDLSIKSLYYRTEIVIFIIAFIFFSDLKFKFCLIAASVVAPLLIASRISSPAIIIFIASFQVRSVQYITCPLILDSASFRISIPFS